MEVTFLVEGLLGDLVEVVEDLLKHLVLRNTLDVVDLLVGGDLVAYVLEQMLVLEIFEDFYEVDDVSSSDALDHLTGIVGLNQLIIGLLILCRFNNFSHRLIFCLLLAFKSLIKFNQDIETILLRAEKRYDVILRNVCETFVQNPILLKV